MFNLRYSITKVIAIALFVFISVTGFVLYKHFFTLYITSSNPSFSNVSYQTPAITLYFNKEIDSESVGIEDTEQLFYLEENKIDKSSITLYTNTINLKAGQKKSFALTAKSVDGHEINEVIQLTIKDISFEKLPDDQKKLIKDIEDRKPDYYKDPIMQYIPYSTLEYSIDPNFTTIDSADESKETDVLVLDIKVYLSDVDIDEGEDIVSQRYLEQAKNYIRSKGLDPEKYSINFSIERT